MCSYLFGRAVYMYAQCVHRKRGLRSDPYSYPLSLYKYIECHHQQADTTEHKECTIFVCIRVICDFIVSIN